MLQWLKKHWNTIVIVMVTGGMLFFMYACESKVESLNDKRRLITRVELQVELDEILSMAQIKIADLDRQDELRAVVLQNALILVQGQPMNPVGILTAVAGIYGILSASNTAVKKVKQTVEKKRSNNG